MYNGINNDYLSDSNNKSKTFAVFLVFLAIVCFGAYFYYNYKAEDNHEKSNDTSTENNNEIINNLVGTWKSTKQTEPSKDNVYLIPNVLLQINNDGTCYYKGTYKLRYTDHSGGSTLGADYDCKVEINKMNNQIRIVPNNEDAQNAFHKNYTRFTLDGDVLILGSFEYIRTSGSSDTSTNNDITITDNQIIGTWYYYMDGKINDTTYYVFNADGTGKYFLGGEPINIKYKIEGNSLFINASGIDRFKENSYKINNNMLTINDGVGDTTFIKK